MTEHFLQTYVKLFFLLTPFFVLSAFLVLTAGSDLARRRRVAAQVTVAVIIACLALLLFGNILFQLFGVTVDSFRVGAGAILFLSGISMVRGEDAGRNVPAAGTEIAVVPLAIPITVGPGTTGALLVMGTELSGWGEWAVGAGALFAAVASVGLLLFAAVWLERALGKSGLLILSKLTGLFVAAIAAQIAFTGARNLLAER